VCDAIQRASDPHPGLADSRLISAVRRRLDWLFAEARAAKCSVCRAAQLQPVLLEHPQEAAAQVASGTACGNRPGLAALLFPISWLEGHRLAPQFDIDKSIQNIRFVNIFFGHGKIR
jgi:hypothetical protein